MHHRQYHIEMNKEEENQTTSNKDDYQNLVHRTKTQLGIGIKKHKQEKNWKFHFEILHFHDNQNKSKGKLNQIVGENEPFGAECNLRKGEETPKRVESI